MEIFVQNMKFYDVWLEKTQHMKTQLQYQIRKFITNISQTITTAASLLFNILQNKGNFSDKSAEKCNFNTCIYFFW